MSAILPPIGRLEPVFLGLGANLGDPLAQLQSAVEAIDADARTTVQTVSSVYETEPIGGPRDQPTYLNIAVYALTGRSPRRLLRVCADIEARLGRVRGERWGPRAIDIDILLYAARVVQTRDLQIPHPRLAERPFALIPLIEVAPGMSFPDGTSLTSALAKLAPVEGVRMIGSQVRLPEGKLDSPPAPPARPRIGRGRPGP
ncbi:MAG TPA: 2-amino-4-hydroxy-6-hydroxymethyldihydropteridine diphosphokinase [Egibacteraceae bacterium]|nr:2-amino-4-hydroxy-6-hydroxymethyldihydropteridine diphosphokinase [Egibacteraceae bacterium]